MIKKRKKISKSEHESVFIKTGEKRIKKYCRSEILLKSAALFLFFWKFYYNDVMDHCNTIFGWIGIQILIIFGLFDNRNLFRAGLVKLNTETVIPHSEIMEIKVQEVILIYTNNVWYSTTNIGRIGVVASNYGDLGYFRKFVQIFYAV